jgi:hypothetical protein
MAFLAVIVGAIAVWNVSPAGADPVVAQAAPAASPAASPAPSPTPTATPPPHLLQVSGFADAGYTSASIASAVGTPGGSTISARVFDTLNQQIQFHNFNLQVAYGGPIGGKVEASFGDDANVINSYPKSVFANGTSIDLTQAYLSLTSGQFTGIVGKFETLAGAEVIESPSDLNFSRSILFGFAVPFTHTGGRLTWAMNSNLSFIAGVNMGWDTTTQEKNSPFVYPDTNSLTIEGGAAWNPSKAFGMTIQGYTGQVQEGLAVALPTFPVNFTPLAPARPNRSVIDTVLTYHMTPSLTFVLNGDLGQQTNSVVLDNTGTPFGYGTGTWSGVAGYANYAINTMWSATLRAEYFADYGGLRTGISQRWAEATATLQYMPNSNVILRGELRGDKSNQNYFVGQIDQNTGLPNLYHTNAQFGIEAIVKYP